MKSQSCPVHPDFNTLVMRDIRARDARRFRCATTLRVVLIPPDAPATVAPFRHEAISGVGIINGASGFLPCIQVKRSGFVDLAAFTRDGAPVVCRSARKAWRASLVNARRAITSFLV